VLAFPGPPEPLPPGVPLEFGGLAHLAVHGPLHLLGYTHDGEANPARIEELETRVLAGLGIPDPYVSQ